MIIVVVDLADQVPSLLDLDRFGSMIIANCDIVMSVICEQYVESRESYVLRNFGGGRGSPIVSSAPIFEILLRLLSTYLLSPLFCICLYVAFGCV